MGSRLQKLLKLLESKAASVAVLHLHSYIQPAVFSSRGNAGTIL
jgi:hypothetical protein